MFGLPRAGWSNLLATSPQVVMGLASSATAIQNAITATFAAGTTGVGLLGVGLLGFDGTNYQRVTGQSDGTATGGTIFGVVVGGQTSAGGTIKHLRVDGFGNQDNTSATTSALAVLSFSTLYNNTNWERQRSASTVHNTTGTGLPGVAVLGYDAANYQRILTNSAANISATTQVQAIAVAEPGEWTVTSAPGLAAQASASKGAGAAGVRHVCRSFVCTLGGTVNSGAVTFNLRDGASGAGTIKWGMKLYALANQSAVICISGLNIFGSAATAMTLETSGATAANVEASTSMSGYSTV